MVFCVSCPTAVNHGTDIAAYPIEVGDNPQQHLRRRRRFLRSCGVGLRSSPDLLHRRVYLLDSVPLVFGQLVDPLYYRVELFKLVRYLSQPFGCLYADFFIRPLA